MQRIKHKKVSFAHHLQTAIKWKKKSVPICPARPYIILQINKDKLFLESFIVDFEACERGGIRKMHGCYNHDELWSIRRKDVVCV